MFSLSPTDRLLVRCPRCSGTLVPAQLKQAGASALVSECSVCQGHWTEPGDLERLVAAGEIAPVEAQRISPLVSQRKPMGCPKCAGHEMAQVAADGSRLFVDVCPRCLGSWLDGGELLTFGRERLLAALVSTYRVVRDSPQSCSSGRSAGWCEVALSSPRRSSP
ncbi:MAG: zf-TFIIB domain-containing protein [Myxococcales bacterium]